MGLGKLSSCPPHRAFVFHRPERSDWSVKPTFPVLLAISVILAAGFILFPQGLERAAARGEAELEVSWLPGSGGESLNIVKSLSWQGQIGRLRLPAAVELKLGKAVQGSFTFEKGQLSLHRATWSCGCFTMPAFAVRWIPSGCWLHPGERGGWVSSCTGGLAGGQAGPCGSVRLKTPVKTAPAAVGCLPGCR